jgi:ferric-dicitrate binding protein FerR (iron transport regulator)
MSGETNEHQKELTDWLNGDLSNEELKKVIGENDLSKYSQILNEIDEWQPSIDADILDPKLITQKKTKTRSLSTWQYMSVAASILIVFVVSFLVYQNNSETEYYSGFGETKEILLPDGKSTVILGSNSTIALKRKSWKKSKRHIALTGKAHFKVEKGNPFRVETVNGTVEVLGTQFDVNQFDENLQVVCYEGSVRATSNAMEALIIKSGESSIFFNNAWEEKQVVELQEPKWILDEVKFEKAPISLVIKELIAIYDITFDRGNLNLQRRFTGAIPKDNLKQALQIVFGTLGIEYKLENKKVILND